MARARSVRTGFRANRFSAAHLLLLGGLAAGAALHFAFAARRIAERPLFQNEYRNMGLNIAADGVMKDISGPGPSARRMPLYPVFLSVFSAPGDRGLPAYGAQALLGVLSVLLAFTAACGLGGPAAGLAAAAAVALDGSVFGMFAATGVECLFAFAILVSFNAVLLWAEKPSARTAALAGLGIGATLLCRSTLILLPPLLAAAALRGSRGLRKTAGLLVLFSYLPLAPWAARNAVLLKGFIPFENFSPAPVLYAASQGKMTLPDPWEAVADAGKQAGRDVFSMSDLEKSRLMTRLALENIARSPEDYALGALKRLIGYWNYRLVLFIPALFWLIRRRPGPAPALAGVFAACFSVNALVTLDAAAAERVLYPALPVLDCVAAAALAGLYGLGGGADSRRPRATRPILPACAAALALLAAATYFFLARETWRYGVRGAPVPGETAQLRDLEEETRLFPQEAKLYNDVGVLLLLEGRKREAAERLQKAVELDPLSKESSDNLAEARRALKLP